MWFIMGENVYSSLGIQIWIVHDYLLSTALVSSCLDYCNSLLYGTVDNDITKPVYSEPTGRHCDKIISF